MPAALIAAAFAKGIAPSGPDCRFAVFYSGFYKNFTGPIVSRRETVVSERRLVLHPP